MYRILSERPSPRREGSPSIRYKGKGWTTERADQGTPSTSVRVAMTCSGDAESAQNRHGEFARGGTSGTSSPVMTQERVMGSLRSSMRKENIRELQASTVISTAEAQRLRLL